MAGATIKIEVDDAEVRALFGRVAAFGAGPTRETLVDIGEYMVRATRARADLEQEPDGVPWVALSPKYARRKQRLRPGVKMLKFDFHMLGDQFSYQPGPDYVDIGTNAPYGARQQFGGGGIPARPWLGASEADLTELRAILDDHLEEALAGR